MTNSPKPTGTKAVTGVVLRNKGVPVLMHRLVEDDQGALHRLEGQTDEVLLRFTNATLADVEETFGSMGTWQSALADTPFSAVLKTLVLMTGRDRRWLGEALLDGQVNAYSSAIGAAFMLASDVDPDAVGKVLAAGLRDEGVRRAKLVEAQVGSLLKAIEAEEQTLAQHEQELAEVAAAEATPTPATTGGGRGTSGSKRGRAQAAPSPSSGS